MLRKRIIILLSFFACHHLMAQDSIPIVYPPAERLGVKEGLSQGLIMAMMQDKEGFMWFGTADGLNKYDGYNITVYRHNPDDPYSLPDNSISSLLEDAYGNFWVGTYNKGLYLFDKKRERFYPFDFPGITLRQIRNIRQYGDKLLMTTFNNILIFSIPPVNLLTDPARITQNVQLLFSYDAVPKKPEYKISNTFYGFRTWAPDCSFWVVLPDTVLHYIPGPDFKNWHTNGYSLGKLGIDREETHTVSMMPAGNAMGRMLIYTQNKITAFDEAADKIISITRFQGSFNPPQVSIAPLNDSISIFRDDNSMFVYEENSNKIFKWDFRQEIKNSAFAYTVPLTDASGVTWFGSNGYGALKSDLRRQHFTNYITQSNSDAFFTQLYDGFRPLPAQLREQYDFNYNMIVQDKRGISFFSYDVKGDFAEPFICRYNPATNTLQKLPLPSGIQPFRSSLFLDRQDRLWIAAIYASNRKLIWQLDKTTGKALASFQVPDADAVSPAGFIQQWWQDEGGIFWLATINGLYRFNPAESGTKNEWKHWTHKQGDSTTISSDWVFTVCPDPAEPGRYLWLGTNGSGFDQFDMKTGRCVQHYSEKDGLPNNVVYGILPDDAGNLWMSTNKGLSCFSPTTKTFQNFTSEDGLPGDEFNHFHFRKLGNGRLLFGGVDGFTTFTPEEVLVKQPPAPIVFTGLYISNKGVDWRKDSTIIASPVGYAKTITLHPGQNMFTISFASLEYRSNKKKFYKYKLEGFDKNWTEPATKNEATYTNLSPGNYTFYVTGTNTVGVWNEKGISIEIIVLPWWYQTMLFKLIIVCIVAGGLYGLYRYRLNQTIKLLNIRNRIAGDLHDEIGSTLSSISLFSEVAKKSVNDTTTEAGEMLQQISKSTDNMMEAMDDIVWAINSKNDRFNEVLNRMRAFGSEVLEAKNAALHFNADEKLNHLELNMEQRKNMFLIFKEAINNIAKYSNCNNVWVDISCSLRNFKLQVKDDGKGFATTGKETRSRGGNGIISMRKRALDLNGKLIIESSEENGTMVRLEFRL